MSEPRSGAATSLVRQILEAHSGDVAARAGRTAAPRPDHLLIAPGVTAFVLRLADAARNSAAGAPKAIAWWERSRLATAAGDDEGRELLQCAARLGIPVVAPVAGACEPVYREALAAPGRLVAACGLTAAACGAFGVACVRVSPLEAAALLCGAPLTASETLDARLVFTGSLAPGIGGVDAALEAARRADPGRWAGASIEVSGSGVASLGIGDRVAIARTLAGWGAASVLFPSDDVTRQALRAWGRDSDWREVRPSEFESALTLEVDLDTLEPLVAPGGDPALARPLRHALEHPLRAVTLGPFSDEDDVAVWVRELEGSRVASGLEVTLVPGTESQAAFLASSGQSGALEAAGVQVREPLAASGLERAAGGTRLGSGRAREDQGEWWLANPDVCVASARAGVLADPRGDARASGRPERRARGPGERPAVPAALAADPDTAARAYATVLDPAAGSLRAVVWLVVGDHWTAERIVSRGARARREVLEDPVAGLFPGHDRAWTAQATAGARGVVVAGRNFGAGESCDEAAWSLRRAGVAVVVARSFAPECARALVHAGVLPLEAGRRPLRDVVVAGDELEIPSLPESLEPGHPVGVRNLTRGAQDSLEHRLDAEALSIWHAGGLLARIGASPS